MEAIQPRPWQQGLGAESRSAVIDIGSQSARLVVFADTEDGYPRVLRDERVAVRLAREVQDIGRLGRGGMERLLRCLEDFLALARAAGAGRVTAIATAAVREASDAQELLDVARSSLDLPIEILSGTDEARCAFLGAVYGVPVDRGLLVDLGGGSVEITSFVDREMVAAWSLPLGALRVSDRFLVSDPPTINEIEALRAHAVSMAVENGIGGLRPGESFVGTGGTVRNLAEVHRRHRGRYPVPRIHGYRLTAEDVRSLEAMFLARDVARRASTPGLHRDRADSVAGGAVVIGALMDHLGAGDLLVSGQGLRQGVVLRETLVGPLPPASWVRAASVEGFGSRFRGWDPEAADRRSRLVEGLFDALPEAAVQQVREEVLHAARLMEIGGDVGFYGRYRRAAEAIVESDLSGFSHRSLAVMAAAIEMSDDSSLQMRQYQPLLAGGDRGVLAQAAVALRIGRAIQERLPAGSVLPAWRRGDRWISVGGGVPGGWWSQKLAGGFRRAFGVRLTPEIRPDLGGLHPT